MSNRAPKLLPLLADLRRRCAMMAYMPTLAIDNSKMKREREYTQAEERVLFEHLNRLEPGSPAYLEVRDLIVTHNLRLVLHFVGVLDPQTLAEAEDGLIRATELFDPAHGVKFSTYAVRAIKQRSWRAYRQRLKIDTHEFTETRLRGQRDDGTGSRPLDRSGRVDPNLGGMERQERDAEVRQAMLRLKWRDREVLRRRFYDGMTLDQVARRLGIAKERVRQIQNQALAKLRDILAEQEKASEQ